MPEPVLDSVPGHGLAVPLQRYVVASELEPGAAARVVAAGWEAVLVPAFVAEVEVLVVAAVVAAAAVAAAAVAAAVVVAGAVEAGQLVKPDLGGSWRTVDVAGLAAAAMLLVVPGFQTDCGCLTETVRAA